MRKTIFMNSNVLYDAIVVGLGGVGSFALRSLARKRGLKIMGLERFHIGHELGSSHGGTRLFRHAYFEHPSYVPLCLKSTKTFRELSDWKQSQKKKTGDSMEGVAPLLEDCGVLVVSDGGKSGSYEIIDNCSESANMFGIPTITMDTNDLRNNYGTYFQIPHRDHKFRGLLEPGAGFVRPELALNYALEDAIVHGAEIREGIAVETIHRESTTPLIYKVETSNGTTFRTKGVIISAGAWASKLLPELQQYLKVTRQVQAWFELSDTAKLPPFGWYLDRANDHLPIYGIPADPYSQHPLQSKIAIHGRTVEFDPEVLDVDSTKEHTSTRFRRPSVTEQELEELKDLVQDWIPGAAEGIVRAKACLYTMTPDEHFIVDRRTESTPSNVWYAAGLSGHGFKMTPALGEAMADLVMDGKTDLPVGFLTKDRFEKQRNIK